MSDESEHEARYRLEVVLRGRPISANRYKQSFQITKRDGQAMILNTLTSPALRWLDQAHRVTLFAVMNRTKSMPHPSSWPRPLRFSVFVRNRACDLDNILKVPVDGIKLALGVDDKLYEYGCIKRERGPNGLRIVIESAPLDASQSESEGGSAAEKEVARNDKSRPKAACRITH